MRSARAPHSSEGARESAQATKQAVAVLVLRLREGMSGEDAVGERLRVVHSIQVSTNE
jgi:hypothetical protein